MYMKHAANVLTFILCTQSSVCVLFVTPFYRMAFDDVFVLRDFSASFTDNDVKREVL